MAAGPDVIIIKKKAKGHAAHGAAWKVAYADFVTAMMALFMVLWLVSQTDQTMKKTLSDYFRTGVFSGAPSVLLGGTGISDRGFIDVNDNEPAITPIVLERDAEAVRAAVGQALADPALKALAGQVSVKVLENGILIQIADGRDDLLFDLSSSDSKPALVKLLADLAPTLTHIGYRLELHGHTDARPFSPGAGKNNWTLSFQRAERARTELEKNGFPPELIAGIYAHGSTMPMDKTDPLSPSNRRLSIFARRATPEHSEAKPAGSAAGKTPSEHTDLPSKPSGSAEAPSEVAEHGADSDPH